MNNFQSMTSKTVLTVTNNRDDGSPGTLRWALETFQRSVGLRNRQFEIIFATPEGNPDAGHSYKTGYWTIQLNKPLPSIVDGNIRINFTSPKSVILLPARNERKLEVVGGVSNPIITIGTPYQGFAYYPKANVELNNVNFVRNTAKGGDGERGGGGGLGAGGGIALIGGSLKIYNSIFQDLRAQGGRGSQGAKGGDTTQVRVDMGDGMYEDRWIAQPGEAGGRGGFSSIPERWFEGNPDYRFSVNPGSGGRDGSINGGSGNSPIWIGEAGSSGGGGRGANARNETRSCKVLFVTISNCRREFVRDAGGNGGNGGVGGFGAGGGAGGGAGANGQPGAGGGGGLYAEAGSGGSGQTSSTGGQGGRGGNGAALGGAIAAIRTGIPINLELHNVDFINNTASAGSGAHAVGSLFAHNARVSGSSITLNGQPVQFNVQKDDSDIVAQITSAQNPETRRLVNGLPFHEATSSVRIATVANIRDVVITNTAGVADTNFINFEAPGSGRVGVTADLSNPDNALSQIWRKLVPDREREIRTNYQAQIGQVWLEGGLSVAAGVLGQNTLRKLNNNVLRGVSGFNPVLGFGSTIASNLATAAFGHLQAAKQRDRDLAANAKEQEELKAFLNNNTEAQVGTVNFREERNSIFIEDFTIGEDNIIIGDFGNNPPQLVVGASIKNPGGRTVTIKSGASTNAVSDIVTIELSDQSNNELSESNSSAAEYLATLLRRRPDRSWILGTRQSRPIILRTADQFLGGPAATDVIVDREQNGLGDQQRLSIRTLSGNDQIHGSNGVENIFTGRGDDVVFPGLAPGGTLIDRVNTGPGADTVGYTPIGQPIDVVGKIKRDGREFSQMDISLQSSNTQIAELLEVESIEAYGPSTFKFQDLPDPAANGPSNYMVRTGSGSNFEGSRFNDVVIISYDENTNDSSAGAYSRKSFIDGKGGSNSLYLSFANSPEGISARKLSDNHDLEIKLKSGLSLVEAKSMQFVQVEGSSHDDILDFRNSHSDLILRAGDGDDILRGGKGNDILVAGRGTGPAIDESSGIHGQRMSGGGGKNQFWVMRGAPCYIEDFVVGKDIIVLDQYGVDTKGIAIQPVRNVDSTDLSIVTDQNGLTIFIKHPGFTTNDIIQRQSSIIFSDVALESAANRDTLVGFGAGNASNNSFKGLTAPVELARHLPSDFDDSVPMENLKLRKLISHGSANGHYYKDESKRSNPLLVSGSQRPDVFLGSRNRSYYLTGFRDSVIQGGNRDDYAWFSPKSPKDGDGFAAGQTNKFAGNRISLLGGNDVVSTFSGQTLDLGKGDDTVYIWGGHSDIITGQGRDTVILGREGRATIQDFNIKRDKIMFNDSASADQFTVKTRGFKHRDLPARFMIIDQNKTIATLYLEPPSADFLRNNLDKLSALKDSLVVGTPWPAPSVF
jgi:hypothetical protein